MRPRTAVVPWAAGGAPVRWPTNRRDDRQDAGPLPDRVGDRRRRHGRGLSRHRLEARSCRRPQGAPRGDGRRPRTSRTLRTGSARSGGAQPPAHRDALLRRGGRRHQLHHHGTGRRRLARGRHPRQGAAPRSNPRPWRGARRSACRGARQGHRPSRPEACQCHGDHRRARQGSGLRPGQGPQARRDRRCDDDGCGADRGRRRDGNAGLHVARAAGRPWRRPPHRHLLAGHHAVPDGQRPAPLQRGVVSRTRVGDSPRRAASARGDSAGVAPCPRAGRPALPGEGSRATDPDCPCRRDRAQEHRAAPVVLRHAKRRAVDCRASVREHERGQGSGLLQRRPRGGDHSPAGPGTEPEGHRPHVGVRLSREERRHSQDRAGTGRHARAGGKRAAGRRAHPGDGAADRRFRRRSRMERTVRRRAARHLRRAGRDLRRDQPGSASEAVA